MRGASFMSSNINETSTAGIGIKDTPEIVKKFIANLKIESVMWIILGLLQLISFIVQLCLIVPKDNFLEILEQSYFGIMWYFYLSANFIFFGVISIFYANKKFKQDYRGIVKFGSFSRIPLYFYIEICVILLFLVFLSAPLYVTVIYIILCQIPIVADLIGIVIYVQMHKEEFLSLEEKAIIKETEVKPEIIEEKIIKEVEEEKEIAPAVTVSEEKKEINSENTSSNKIICPNCGKEQVKNQFGCIYCHCKWE